MRFYPWLNNSGGFFVCLLRKTDDLPVCDESTLIENNAMNYEKLNAKETIGQTVSNPQKRMDKQEVIAAI